jgi:type VI secretion system secreted protein Hcp
MSSVDYWLKIEGVEGESTDDKLKGLIQIQSWSWSEKNVGSFSANGGGGAGKVQMDDFKFKMDFNKASPKLFVACATGQHIASAQLICRKAGGGQQTYLTIDFEKVLVSSFITESDVTGDQITPLNTISFNFEKIVLNYSEQGADGSVGATTTAGYDLKKNAKT